MHDYLAPILGITGNHIIHCGLSLGWEDDSKKVNNLRTVREDLNNFVKFHEM